MSVIDIQEKVAQLDSNDLESVSQFLFGLELKRDPNLKKELARRLDDKSEGTWVSAEEVEQGLAELNDKS